MRKDLRDWQFGCKQNPSLHYKFINKFIMYIYTSCIINCIINYVHSQAPEFYRETTRLINC